MNQNRFLALTEIESTQNGATALVLAAIEAAQAAHHLFPIATQKSNKEPRSVIVGVSGGADSVCLLHALSLLAPKWNLSLHVAHVDHNLRLESGEDATFVQRLATQFGHPFHLHRITAGTLETLPGGVENAARNARYTFFQRLSAHLAANYAAKTEPNIASDALIHPREKPVPILVPVAVAHHADDQVETLLMRMVRGSGLRGLGGMRWSQEFQELIAPSDRPDVSQPALRVVRPLLGITGQQIRSYLAEQKLVWVEDTSNRSIDILRNRIRHQVVPLLKEINPNLTETMARTADILAAEADRAKALDQAALQAITLEQSAQRWLIDLDRFLALDEKATQREILRLALGHLMASAGKEHKEISYQHIDTLLYALHPQQSATGPHPIVGNLAWSVAGARPDPRHNSPQHLSLHWADAAPFAADHPYLDEAWRKTTKQVVLPKSGVVSVDHRWALHIENGPIDLATHDNNPANQNSWDTGNPWQAHFDAEQIETLILRSPQTGDRIAPLGMHGKSKKVGDLLTDHKVPNSLRSGWPLIVDGESGALLWVCGIHIAHHARITKKTRRLLHLEWRELRD